MVCPTPLWEWIPMGTQGLFIHSPLIKRGFQLFSYWSFLLSYIFILILYKLSLYSLFPPISLIITNTSMMDDGCSILYIWKYNPFITNLLHEREQLNFIDPQLILYLTLRVAVTKRKGNSKIKMNDQFEMNSEPSAWSSGTLSSVDQNWVLSRKMMEKYRQWMWMEIKHQSMMPERNSKADRTVQLAIYQK